MGGSPGIVPRLSEILWHTRIYTLTEGNLDGWQTQDSPGTVRVTVAYWDTLTEGDLYGWQSREGPGTVKSFFGIQGYSDRGGSGWVAVPG